MRHPQPACDSAAPCADLDDAQPHCVHAEVGPFGDGQDDAESYHPRHSHGLVGSLASLAAERLRSPSPPAASTASPSATSLASHVDETVDGDTKTPLSVPPNFAVVEVWPQDVDLLRLRVTSTRSVQDRSHPAGAHPSWGTPDVVYDETTEAFEHDSHVVARYHPAGARPEDGALQGGASVPPLTADDLRLEQPAGAERGGGASTPPWIPVRRRRKCRETSLR